MLQAAKGKPADTLGFSSSHSLSNLISQLLFVNKRPMLNEAQHPTVIQFTLCKDLLTVSRELVSDVQRRIVVFSCVL